MFVLQGVWLSVLRCFLQIRPTNSGCIPAVICAKTYFPSFLTKVGLGPLLLLLLDNSSINPSPVKGDLLSRTQQDTVMEKSTKKLGQKGLRIRQLDATNNHK